ncbi:MAG: hypothetical protein AAF355_11125 [Myxococcota bacterium]
MASAGSGLPQRGLSFSHCTRPFDCSNNLKLGFKAISGADVPKLPKFPGDNIEKKVNKWWADISPCVGKLTPPLLPDDIEKLANRSQTEHSRNLDLLSYYYELYGNQSPQASDMLIANSILHQLGKLHTHRQIATALCALRTKGVFAQLGYDREDKWCLLATHLRVIEWLHYFKKANIRFKGKRPTGNYVLVLLMADGLLDSGFIDYWRHSAYFDWSHAFCIWRDNYDKKPSGFPEPFDDHDPLYRLYHAAPAVT